MKKYEFAAYKNGIISVHNSSVAAKRKAGKNGYVLEADKDVFGNHRTFGEYNDQVFKAPKEAEYHYIVFDGKNTKLD